MKNIKSRGVVLTYEVAGPLLLQSFGYLYNSRTILTGADSNYRRELGKVIVKFSTTSFEVKTFSNRIINVLPSRFISLLSRRRVICDAFRYCTLLAASRSVARFMPKISYFSFSEPSFSSLISRRLIPTPASSSFDRDGLLSFFGHRSWIRQ